MTPYYIAFILMAVVDVKAQPVIRTIAPEKAVAAGEPFRIQFVVENSSGIQRFSAPDFNGLKIVRGPELYPGSQIINGRKTEITNYVYTMVAEKTGIYKIGAASVKLNGLIYPGNEISIKVIKKEIVSTENIRDDISAYVLMTGEDPTRKIKKNLFVKLFVDKQSCFVGEPVVATFKLFSRLQSKSEIIKNPGFYGFSVYDMVGLDDKVKETERIRGKDFDVHTLRKVQLYPLQPGQFTIDEMKIENKVEFSRSMVRKKTEQQISEGVLSANDDETNNPGTEVFNSNLITDAVIVKVNPLPVKNKPADFNGATGNFTIKAKFEKKELDKNEEGYFIVTIDGKGNFPQITAPVIQWPKELEGFEPSVKDFLDNRTVPLSGSRVFRYPFISSKPGNWLVPAVKFSFFNKSVHNYQSISTDTLFVRISNKEFKKKETTLQVDNKKKISIDEANRRVSRIAFILVALLVTGVITYWIIQGRKNKNETRQEGPVVILPAVDEIFERVVTDQKDPDEKFYAVLHQSVWQYLAQLYNLSGTEINKNFLAVRMKQNKNDEMLISELVNLLTRIETAMFTNIDTEDNRQDLMDKIKFVLKQLRA